jgi:lactate dehydrogenase-like 2-hydroxyacid dehydrogenase
VVDTDALIDALRSGRPGAAGLDVYESEPHVPRALRELPNTVLLPHVGSATARTRDAMARLCAENVLAVIDGRDPPTPVV